MESLHRAGRYRRCVRSSRWLRQCALVGQSEAQAARKTDRGRACRKHQDCCSGRVLRAGEIAEKTLPSAEVSVIDAAATTFWEELAIGGRELSSKHMRGPFEVK